MFFASESNSYPLFYHQSPSCTNAILDNGNTLFHHHHHGRYNDNYLLQPTYPSSSENPIVKLSSEPSINQENTINYPSNMTNPMSDTRRSTGKKDRHTKICTAQGIRDRRVRLSMSIAREFFNLQDMLGFDKASETLGWLLTKSKAAIDELSNTSNNSYTITPIEELNEEYDENVDDEKSGLTEISSSKKRKRRELNHLKEQNSVEEVRREKARERARERTRKKKTIVDDHNNHHQQQHQLESLDHHHHQIHQRVQQDLMICQSSYSATSNSIPTISKGVNVGEAVVTKDNKSRSRSSVNYNYDMMSLKDDQESGNHYNDCFNKSAYENCNCSGIMQQPAGLFPALNIINLSTEIHINARPWDTCINQIQHY